jgi:SAM-dependent methyltransferase
LKFSEIYLKTFEETQAFVLKKSLIDRGSSFDLVDTVYPLDFTKQALSDAGFENFHILPTVPINGDVKRAEFID